MCLTCPSYVVARTELFCSASATVVHATDAKDWFTSHDPKDWAAIARYVAKVRHGRRRLKAKYE